MHPPISAVIVIRNLLQVGIAYTCGQIYKLSQGVEVKPQIQHNGPGQLQHDRPRPPFTPCLRPSVFFIHLRLSLRLNSR